MILNERTMFYGHCQILLYNRYLFGGVYVDQNQIKFYSVEDPYIKPK